MSQANLKGILPWVLVITIFSIGFYLSSNRINPIDQTTLSAQSNFSDTQINEVDYSVKQKLADDFENAFLKQYTPLIGCEDLELKIKPNKCVEHLQKAKNDFKQQFIKNRGLPKDTFENLKLSYVD